MKLTYDLLKTVGKFLLFWEILSRLKKEVPFFMTSLSDHPRLPVWLNHPAVGQAHGRLTRRRIVWPGRGSPDTERWLFWWLWHTAAVDMSDSGRRWRLTHPLLAVSVHPRLKHLIFELQIYSQNMFGNSFGLHNRNRFGTYRVLKKSIKGFSWNVSHFGGVVFTASFIPTLILSGKIRLHINYQSHLTVTHQQHVWTWSRWS